MASSGDPLSDDQVRRYEAQAGNLFAIGLSQYRTMPDPQLVHQSLTTQTVPQVAAAYQSGDPIYGDAINAIPQGTTGIGAKLTSAQATPYSFDPDTYKRVLASEGKDNLDEVRSYASLGGEIPIPNYGWYAQAVGRLQKDPNYARTYQSMFRDQGFLDANHPVDGQWDPATQDALFKYMWARSLPDAFFSKDKNTQQSAQIFLTQLASERGAPINLDDLKKDLLSQPNGTSQIISSWLATAPDGHHRARALISQYSNAYGDENMPQGWKDLKEGGVWTGIMDSVAAVADAPNALWGTALSLADKIPVVGGGVHDTLKWGPLGVAGAALHGISNAVDGAANLFEGHGFSTSSPGEKAEKIAFDDLTQEDKQDPRVASALQDVHDSQGFLGDAFHVWGQDLTQLQLDTVYFLGDGLSGKGWDNPFDANDRMRKGAEMHRDDLAAGILGDFFKEHPEWEGPISTLVNLGGAMLDPTMFIPGLGEGFAALKFAGKAAELGAKLEKAEKAASVAGRLADKESISAARSALSNDDRLINLTNSRWRATFKPKAFTKELTQKLLPYAYTAADNVLDRAILLGVHDEDRLERLVKHSTDEKGQFKRGDLNSARDFLTDHDNGFSHLSDMLGTHYNYKAASKALTPEVAQRLSAGRLRAMLIWGGTRMRSGHLDWSNKGGSGILNSAHAVRDLALAAGMSPDEIAKYLNRIMIDAVGDKNVDFHVDKFVEKIKEVLGEDKLNQVTAWKARRSGVFAGGRTFPYLFSTEPDAAKLAAGAPAERSVVGGVPEHLLGEAASINEAKKTMTSLYVHSITGTAVDFDDERAVSQAVAAFEKDPANRGVVKKHYDSLAELDRKLREITTEKRAVPMFPSQTKSKYQLPFTAYDVLVAGHPVLRKMEEFQVHSLITAVNQLWKLYAIAKPSTAIKAGFGDDTMRVVFGLLADGHPRAALSMLAKGPGGGVGAVFSKKRRQNIEEDDFLRNAGRVDVQAGLSPYVDPYSHIPLHPGESDYVHALRSWLSPETAAGREGRTGIGDLGRRWAQAIMEGRDGRQEIANWWHEEGSEQDRLASSRGMVKERKVAKQQRDHERKAGELEVALRDLDAKQGVYASGPRKGQPKFAAAQYKEAYSAYRKHEHTVGGKGNYRDRMVAALEHHRNQAASTPAIVEETIDQAHNFLSDLLRNKELLEMAATGKVDTKKVQKMIKESANVGSGYLPVITGRKQTVFGNWAGLRRLEKGGDWLVNHFMEPYIMGSRAESAIGIRDYYRDHLTDHYKGVAMKEGRIEAMATAHAQSWMLNNTYQFHRGMADVALRNIYPFLGATRSMDTYWINQVKAHPWTAVPLAKFLVAQQSGQSGASWRIPLPSSPVTSFLGDHDSLTIDPAKLLYASSEGLGSMIPSTGPLVHLMSPIFTHDANMARAVQQVTGKPIDGGILPGWMQPVASAVGLKTVGKPFSLPGLTSKSSQDYDRQKDMLVRSFVAENHRMPTEDEINSQLAKEEAVRGVASFGVPLGVSTQDPVAKSLSTARKEFDAATTEEQRQQVIARHPDVAPILQYLDPATPPETKTQLAIEHPEVVAYTTSFYEGVGDKPVGLPEFQAAVAGGSEHIQSLPEYTQTLQHHYDIEVGWEDYNRTIREPTQQWLQDHPDLGPGSAEYRQFQAEVIAPRLVLLQDRNKAWAEKFGKGLPRTTAGKIMNSQPISTLASWSVIPKFPEFQTPQTNAWRNVIAARDQVASELAGLRNQGASQQEMKQVVDVFDQWLLDNYGDDPEMARELDLYHWGRVNDFLDLQERADLEGQSGSQ